MTGIHRRKVSVEDRRVLEYDSFRFRRITFSAATIAYSTPMSNFTVTVKDQNNKVLRFMAESNSLQDDLSISDLMSNGIYYLQEPVGGDIEAFLSFSIVDSTPSRLASLVPESLSNGGAWLASFVPQRVSSSVSTVTSYVSGSWSEAPLTLGKAKVGEYYEISSELDKDSKGSVSFSVNCVSARS